jgi:hypothetical protein
MNKWELMGLRQSLGAKTGSDARCVFGPAAFRLLGLVLDAGERVSGTVR